MDDDDTLREILRRLEALEARLDSMGPSSPPPGPPPPTPPPSSGSRSLGEPCVFHGGERRIVDLIVGLTTEKLMAEIDARMEGRSEHDQGRDGRDEDRPRSGRRRG